MTAARNVYIIIFFMALLPIAFFSVKGFVKPKRPGASKVRRSLCLVYGIVGTALAMVACLFLYRFTIARQPLLVSERAAVLCLDTQSRGGDAAAALQEAGLAGNGVVVQLEGLDAAVFDGTELQMPQKLQVAEGGVGYPVLLETDDVYCVLGVVMDETGETPQVLAIQAYFGEDAKAFLDGKMTFYGSSTYKLPKA